MNVSSVTPSDGSGRPTGATKSPGSSARTRRDHSLFLPPLAVIICRWPSRGCAGYGRPRPRPAGRSRSTPSAVKVAIARAEEGSCGPPRLGS